MTPAAVVRQAVSRGMGIIVVCDHNSAENLAAVKRAAEHTQLRVIGGMEITTSEEVHVLGLFDGEDGLRKMQGVVYDHLPGKNDVDILDHTDGAVEYITDCTPDVLVLDVMFPDRPVAGFDLARKIRREPKIRSLPIVLLTGMNQEFPMGFSASDIDPEWLPVQDFVEKPVLPRRLLTAINHLLKT